MYYQEINPFYGCVVRHNLILSKLNLSIKEVLYSLRECSPEFQIATAQTQVVVSR